MDGRNAGSAVIGFVNGMYIIKYHSPHFPKERKKELFSCIQSTSFSLIHTHTTPTQKEKFREKNIETFKKIWNDITKQNT